MRKACLSQRIFPFLSAEEGSLHAPWCANKYIEINHDFKLKHVVGAVTVEEPREIWKLAKGHTT